MTRPERSGMSPIADGMDPVTLRSQAIRAASLAAKSGDREIAKLLLMVSEELEEEACRLEMKRGDPQLDWAAPLANIGPGGAVRASP